MVFKATANAVTIDYLGAKTNNGMGRVLRHIKLIQEPIYDGYAEEDGYRYGFNTQQKQDDIYGPGNHTTALYWEYDTRLGRRWNLDPKPNPSISKYACFNNNPIGFSDIFGDTITINLFNTKVDSPLFHMVANSAVKNQVNDGVFLVFGHGSPRSVQFTDKNGMLSSVKSSTEFNKMLAEICPEFKQALEEGKQMVLKVYACNTASEEFFDSFAKKTFKTNYTIAERIADGLPDGSKVIAADGYVWFGKSKGKPTVLGVQQTSEKKPINTYNGGFITIQKGQKHIAKQKMAFNTVTQRTKKGKQKDLTI